MGHREREATRSGRAKGGVLAEFALVSFVIWLLLAGVLELGRAFSAQQILQHAARTIARELSQRALAHDATFAVALHTALDLRFLVIDSQLLRRCGLADFDEAGHSADLDQLFQQRLPVGNRLLRPLMFRDRVGDLELLRYPGAVLARTDATLGPTSDCAEGSSFVVGIPLIDESSGQVRWIPVAEEEPGADPVAGRRVGFALAEGGWVGLRIHYPFQAAALPGVRDAGPVDPRTGVARQRFDDADRAHIDQGLEALGATLLFDDGGSVPRDGVAAYAGPRGLGRLSIAGAGDGDARVVRPWRRLLSASAGFRRELFLPTGGAS